MTLGVSVAKIVENSTNPLLKAHPSWQRILLGDVAEILNGFAFSSSKFSKDRGFPILRIRDIGKIKTEAFYTGEFDEIFIVRYGDLVIGMDGDFNCARWMGESALLNQRVCKVTLKSPNYNPKFLEYVLPGYLKAINENTSSVTVKHLSSRTIAEIPLPYPPLSEQEKIVAKIEELFTQLEAGTAALRRVQAGLKRYKASVLKAAVEGRLVEGGTRVKEGELPEGWRWVTIEEITDGSKYALKAGPFGSSLKKEFYVPNGYKIYGQEQVIRNDPYYGDYYIDEERYELLKANSVKPGDVLISLVGTIGKVLILPEDIEPGIINPRLVKLSLDRKIIESRYFDIYLQTASAQHYFSTVSHGETMDVLNLGILRRLPIPLPPISEQNIIIEDIERLLSVAREIEAAVETAIKRSARLRQAVLKAAFEGGLV